MTPQKRHDNDEQKRRFSDSPWFNVVWGALIVGVTLFFLADVNAQLKSKVDLATHERDLKSVQELVNTQYKSIQDQQAMMLDLLREHKEESKRGATK